MKTEILTIEDMFLTSSTEKNNKEKIFNIPYYQRDFVWKTQKINNAWNEIFNNYLESLEIGKNKLYFGVIYLHKTSKKDIDIVDGQQRATFFKYIFEAFKKIINDFQIKDILEQNKNNIKKIENDPEIIRKVFEFITKINETNFNLTVHNNEFKSNVKYNYNLNIFYNLVFLSLYKEFESEKHLTPRLLVKMNKFTLDLKNTTTNKILKKFNNIFNNSNAINDDALDDALIILFRFSVELMNLYKIIFKFVDINRIKIEKENKYEVKINDIFSAINSTAVPLTQWDLIKNEMYKLSKDSEVFENEQLIEYSIDAIEKNFGDNKINSEIFINAWMSFKTERYIDKNKTFFEFENYFGKNKEDIFSIKKFSKTLEETYENIVTGKSSAKRRENNIDILWRIYKISKELKNTQIQRFIIGYYLKNKTKLTDKENKLNLNNLEKQLLIMIINIFLFGERGNQTEAFFKSNYKKMINNDVNMENFKDTDVYKFFKNDLDSFSDHLNETKKETIKLITYLYYYKKIEKKDPDIIRTLLNFEYEHIIPSKMNEDVRNTRSDDEDKEKLWLNVDEKTFKDYAKKIGNITLLSEDLNKKASDKDINSKVKIIQESKTDKLVNTIAHNNPSDYIIFDKIPYFYNIGYQGELFSPIVNNQYLWTKKSIDKRTDFLIDELEKLIKDIFLEE